MYGIVSYPNGFIHASIYIFIYIDEHFISFVKSFVVWCAEIMLIRNPMWKKVTTPSSYYSCNIIGFGSCAYQRIVKLG